MVSGDDDDTGLTMLIWLNSLLLSVTEITMMSRSKHLSLFSSFSHRSVNLTFPSFAFLLLPLQSHLDPVPEPSCAGSGLHQVPTCTSRSPEAGLGLRWTVEI